MTTLGKTTQKCSGNTDRALCKDRTRAYALTCWVAPTFNELQMSYLIFGHETCPDTGRDHWQTFVRFRNAKTWTAAKKYFDTGDHIQATHGTDWENIAYCSKDDKFEEFGERPSQGSRADLMRLRDEIASGTSVDAIALENPNVFHQYGRTLNKLEDLAMRKKFRTEMTKGVWYHGTTGVGKSHKAFENFTPETHYVLPNDNGWWDGYTQQETVIINDFRGWIAYDYLLQIVDKWPLSVKRRGREPIPFMSKTVIITSSLGPEEVYHNREANDSIEQLMRRFEIIFLTPKVKVLIPPCFRK